MPSQDDAYLRHQQKLWLRPDGDRWVRPDAARFLKPGTRIEDVYPVLALKYSPNQPRVPAGNPDGGQWTDGDGGWGDAQAQAARREEIDPLGLFGIAPREPAPRGVQLAGDLPDGLGGPTEDPPEIPKQIPEAGKIMKFVRDAAQWLARVGPYSAAADSFYVAARKIGELNSLTDMIRTANDPPRELEDLIERAAGPKQRGYHRHHIAEEDAARKDGFPEAMIQRRDNLALVPAVKHIDITAEYMRKELQPDGTVRSLRDYLRGKDFETRQEIGRAMMRKHGVLK